MVTGEVNDFSGERDDRFHDLWSIYKTKTEISANFTIVSILSRVTAAVGVFVVDDERPMERVRRVAI